MLDLSLVCDTSTSARSEPRSVGSDAGAARAWRVFLLPGGLNRVDLMTVYDAIVLRLSEKRGGNILPTKVIKTVSKFLAEVVGLEDAKDFSLLDLLSVVDEAWYRRSALDVDRPPLPR